MPTITKSEIVLLNTNNYHQWRHVIKGQLEEEGHWLHVSGLEEFDEEEPLPPKREDYLTPEEHDTAHKDYKKLHIEWFAAYKTFEKPDSKARGFIRNRLDETQKILVKDATTAHEMWTLLEEAHKTSRGGINVILLKIEMTRRRWDGRSSKSLADHLDWLIRSNDELATVGREVSDNDLAIHMLCSVPPEHNASAASLYANYGQSIQYDDLDSKDVRSKLEETFRWCFRDDETSTVNINPPSMTSTTSTPDQSALAANASSSNGRPWCDHCKKHGHMAKKCWTLHPELRPPKKPTNALSAEGAASPFAFYTPQQAQNILQNLFHLAGSTPTHSLLAEPDATITDALATKLKTIKRDRIYIDSGSSRHLCPHIDWYDSSSLTPLSTPITIRVGNNQSILGTHTGTIRLIAKLDGDKTLPLTVSNVVYAPAICTVLLSVSQLSQTKHLCHLHLEDSHIQHLPTKQVVGRCPIEYGMYPLDAAPIIDEKALEPSQCI